MFDIGFSEVILIFGLALVVLGPEKLPKLARTVGHWVGRARAMARQFQDQLETEAETIKSSVNDVKQNVENSFSEVKSAVSEAGEQIAQLGTDAADAIAPPDAVAPPDTGAQPDTITPSATKPLFVQRASPFVIDYGVGIATHPMRSTTQVSP